MDWWPGTESNRRRRPFQGRLPNRRSGLKSTDVTEGKELMRVGDLEWRRMVWAVFASSMYAYCTRSVSNAGGIFVNRGFEEAVTDGNLVTGPAWTARVAWLRQFLHVLRSTLVLLGIEKVRIVPGLPLLTRLIFITCLIPTAWWRRSVGQ